MIKSELQIEQDLFDLLKDELKGMISGSVYKQGMRPVDAQTEDAVISVSDASADQIQLGHAQINVYVTDIDGQPDKSRLTELSTKHEYLCDLLNQLTTDEYHFYPSRAARPYEIPELHQHFVNFEIEFQRTTY